MTDLLLPDLRRSVGISVRYLVAAVNATRKAHRHSPLCLHSDSTPAFNMSFTSNLEILHRVRVAEDRSPRGQSGDEDRVGYIWEPFGKLRDGQ